MLVHWLDITSVETPWLSEEEAVALKPTEMWSAGVIVAEDEHSIVLAGTIDPSENSYGNVNAIPRGVIVSTRGLKLDNGPIDATTDAVLRDTGIG